MGIVFQYYVDWLVLQPPLSFHIFLLLRSYHQIRAFGHSWLLLGKSAILTHIHMYLHLFPQPCWQNSSESHWCTASKRKLGWLRIDHLLPINCLWLFSKILRICLSDVIKQECFFCFVLVNFILHFATVSSGKKVNTIGRKKNKVPD